MNPVELLAPVVRNPYVVSGVMNAALGGLLGWWLHRPAENRKGQLDTAQTLATNIQTLITVNEEQQRHLDKQDRIMAQMVREIRSLRAYVSDLCGLLAEHGIAVPPEPVADEVVTESRSR